MTARQRAAPRGPLAGRTALVTGAGSGVGRAIASALGDAGAKVVLAARTRRAVEAAARGLRARGVRALAVPCDVRDEAQVAGLVAATVDRFRRLDVLVHAAGIFRIASIADTDLATWNAVLETNLTGTFLVTRAALPHLRRSRGRIVVLASIAARVAYPGNAAYCASKWGVLGFTNVLRDEVQPRGVRVTALLPGPIDTPIWDGVPGRWDRRRMLRPATLARSVVEICTQPPDAAIDEVVLMPAGGRR